MTRFDALLRQGLMDANLAQYEHVLRKAEAREPDVSPRYRRERTRLLTDPWSWERRSGKRLNWRLIALVAALLLLSACAYAVATGQFAQWFPRMRMDPEAPEVSEEIVSRMGTVIDQSQTVDGVTVTLNAAVWDGQWLSLSLTAEGGDFPEKPDGGMFYDAECYAEPVEEQRAEYLRKQIAASYAAGHIDLTEEELEEKVQFYLELPYGADLSPGFSTYELEGDTLTLVAEMGLFDYVESPELTLHIENLRFIAEYGSDDGEFRIYGVTMNPDGTVETDAELGDVILAGPYDFTFTLDKMIPPVSYEADLEITFEGIPVRIPKITITPFQIRVNYEISEESVTFEQIFEMRATTLWTEDGGAVDCVGGPNMNQLPEGGYEGEIIGNQLHLVDPGKVTAMDIAGTRVELTELKRLSE